MSPEQPNHPPTAGHPVPDRRANNSEVTNANNNVSGYNVPTSMRYEDIHPNTSSVFGSGPGFMDRFDADPHAGERSENVYYPFSSKEEWGLASWLLCSGLSMRAIDDFLALPIVSL